MAEAEPFPKSPDDVGEALHEVVSSGGHGGGGLLSTGTPCRAPQAR